MDILTPYLVRTSKQPSKQDHEIEERISRIEALLAEQNRLLRHVQSAPQIDLDESAVQIYSKPKPTDRYGKVHKKITLMGLMSANYYNCILQNNMDFYEKYDRFNRRLVQVPVNPKVRVNLPSQYQHVAQRERVWVVC